MREHTETIKRAGHSSQATVFTKGITPGLAKQVLCETDRAAARVLVFFDDRTGANDDLLFRQQSCNGCRPHTSATAILRKSHHQISAYLVSRCSHAEVCSRTHCRPLDG